MLSRVLLGKFKCLVVYYRYHPMGEAIATLVVHMHTKSEVDVVCKYVF